VERTSKQQLRKLVISEATAATHLHTIYVDVKQRLQVSQPTPTLQRVPLPAQEPLASRQRPPDRDISAIYTMQRKKWRVARVNQRKHPKHVSEQTTAATRLHDIFVRAKEGVQPPKPKPSQRVALTPPEPLPVQKKMELEPLDACHCGPVTRSQPTQLRWATLGSGAAMTAGVGPVDKPYHHHVALFAMHNLVQTKITFRDSIRIQSLLRCTSVTHVSTVNQHEEFNCVGHNRAHYDKGRDVYQNLRLSCPPTVLWDYNFVPPGYVKSNYGVNLFSGQVPSFFACGANMVVMPNWVTRVDAKKTRSQSLPLLYGTAPENSESCAQGLARIVPGLTIMHVFLSAEQAEVYHPLVVATIAANDTLFESADANAAKACWATNKRYIGEEKAFIVFYNAREIQCPLRYLRSLSHP
jgi:hypothetical protein